MNYIQEKMATVGVGSSDIEEIKTICDALTTNERDILDCWHNNGYELQMSPEFQPQADKLKELHTADDLIVLGAYVSARRNVEEY